MAREATVVTSASEARRLGRYVLVGELGEGGMGRVYLARAAGHSGFEKLVALKVMTPRVARRHPDIADMFIDEARIGALLRHPNICAVLDFGEAQGVRYLVMEYLEGQSLLGVQRRLSEQPDVRRQPTFPMYAARIVAEALEGLHGAHTAVDPEGRPLRVVHRDVSPENLFVTYDGAVKVMDFGIARARYRSHETAEGTFKGKIGYAAPEALASAELDARADIWAAGVVLWELLVGKPLFVRETDAITVGAVLTAPIPPLSDHRSDLGPELEAIVGRALARDPSERFATARDMARELNRCVAARGEHVGTAELSAFLTGLFPEERAVDSEVTRIARGIASAARNARELDPSDAGRALVVSEVRPSPRSAAAAPLAELHSAPTQVTAAPTNEPSAHGFPPPPATEPKPGPRIGPLALRIALALVALAGGIALADFLGDSGEAPSAPAAPAAPAAATPEAPPVPELPVVAMPEPEPVVVDEPEAAEPEAPAPEARTERERAEPRRARTRDATRRAKRSADPRAAEPGTGTVNVFATGSWADIYEGDRRLGRTPARLRLPAGRHTLTLRPPNGPAVQRTVQVTADGSTQLRVEL